MLNMYYANIELVKDPQVFEQWYNKMNEQRRDKILRCNNIEDKQRSLLAGILLEYGLENLSSSANIFSNISHSGDYVICAIADRKVGVDVENKFRRTFLESDKKRLAKVCEKCFTPGEKSCYFASEGQDSTTLFLKYWTRKESYSKFRGMGLAMDFSQIDTEAMDDFYESGWLEDGYYYSVYIEDGDFSDRTLEKICSLQEGT